MSITFSELTKTNYPDGYDLRPDSLNPDPVNDNEYFKENVDFEDRTTNTDVSDYYVKASDINALQESIIAVQKTLGIKPQGTDGSNTVEARFVDIENYILFSDTAYANLDERFMWGGQKPAGLASDANLSIKYHIHDGSDGGASQINLNSHVTGLLPKNNIDLTSGTNVMLCADDIYVTSAKTKTISEALDSKLGISGGAIEDLTIKGDAITKTFAEFDAYSLYSETGFVAADNYAYSGTARYASSSSSSGILCKATCNLRYGQYVLGLRMKVDSNSSTSPICEIKVKDLVSETYLLDESVLANQFDTEDKYQMVYADFDYYNVNGSSDRKPLEFMVYFNTSIAKLTIDSIIVTPMHTSVFDKKTL